MQKRQLPVDDREGVQPRRVWLEAPVVVGYLVLGQSLFLKDQTGYEQIHGPKGELENDRRNGTGHRL